MNQLNLSFLLDFVKEWFTIVNTRLARKLENKRPALTTQTMEEKLRDKKNITLLYGAILAVK